MKPILRRALRSGFTFLPAFWLFCAPSAQDYVSRAEKALAEQDAKKALLLYQNAFDASLPENFLVDDLDEIYSYMDISLDGNSVIAIANRADGAKSHFFIYNSKEEFYDDEALPGFIHSASLSPNGKYAVLTLKRTDFPECKIITWNIEEWEKEEYETSVDCRQKPGISSQGVLLFMREGQIYAYDFSYRDVIENYIEKTPDPPIDGLPAWPNFEFSISDVPFLTFGSAGSYKLYTLKNRNLQLLNKDAASSRIFFYPGESTPGVIVGGANNHQVIFFDPDNPTKIEKTYPVRYWKDALFFGRDYYFFIEENRLYLFAKGEVEPLDIWAQRIFRGEGGSVYFLTPPGRIGRLSNFELPPESRKIFQLGWEL